MAIYNNAPNSDTCQGVNILSLRWNAFEADVRTVYTLKISHIISFKATL
jgi:hypothetical protein